MRNIGLNEEIKDDLLLVQSLIMLFVFRTDVTLNTQKNSYAAY